jgi:hypothetical protein
MAPYLGRVGDLRLSGQSVGGQSSAFEYAEFNDQRASAMTSGTGTTRATRNWYDKPIWDSDAATDLPGSLFDPTSTQQANGEEAMIGRASRASRASAVSASSDVSGVWTIGGEQQAHAGAEGGKGARKSKGKSVRWGDAEEEPLPKVFELARAL